ncbi:hypothetical protein QQF64_025656 [Cirrhinus molitorella]|uniref:Uncharacterized protein n=1 Tax=Cirrhinus molitorella TaxID=172907 RepID=A0ABR3NPP1_9TELE
MHETAESSAGFRIITKEIIKTNSDNRKHHLVNLRPAPLFRTVGLTGLSASLPPHRRLRSVLNTSGQSVNRPDTHQNSTLNGLKCIQDKPLPKILHATHQKAEISMNKQLQTVDIQRWHHGKRLNATVRTRGRDRE